MLSSYNRRVVASPQFKMFVAHLKKSSDPSKGEAGNPEPIRQVFETQVITTSMGTGVLGNVDASTNKVRIKVETTDFGNNRAPDPAPPSPSITECDGHPSGMLTISSCDYLRLT